MSHSLTVVSLGPGDPELLNMKTLSAIRNAELLILRTSRHPVADWLEKQHISFISLDTFYDNAVDFEELNAGIADYIFERSANAGLVYAVPDAYSDLSVRALLARSSEPSMIHIVPGVGFFDHLTSLSLFHLNGVLLTISSASDLLASGYYDPNQSILITELDNPILAGQIKLLLLNMLDDEHEIFLFNGDSVPESMPLYQMDRIKQIDHLTSVLIPGSGFQDRNRFVLRDLAALMEKLRSQDGCPWDRSQTHKSLEPYIVEEAWECVSSIDQNDMDHLCDELGDLLFQIVFHASVGSAFDEFTLDDIITSICRKMIRRHPHVFRDSEKKDIGNSIDFWEKIKREETGHTTMVDSLDDIAAGLPSLKYVSKLLKKLNVNGTQEQILDRIILSVKIMQNKHPVLPVHLGLLLLWCTELCRCSGFDSELILRQTADKLIDKLKDSENKLNIDGKSLNRLTFDQLSVYLSHVEDGIE